MSENLDIDLRHIFGYQTNAKETQKDQKANTVKAVQEHLGTLGTPGFAENIVQRVAEREKATGVEKMYYDYGAPVLAGMTKAVTGVPEFVALLGSLPEWAVRRALGNKEPTVLGKVSDVIGEAGDIAASAYDPTLFTEASGLRVAGEFLGPGALRGVAQHALLPFGKKLAPDSSGLVGNLFGLNTPTKLDVGIAAGAGAVTEAFDSDTAGQLAGAGTHLSKLATDFARGRFSSPVKTNATPDDINAFQAELAELEKLVQQVPGSAVLPANTTVGANVVRSAEHDPAIVSARLQNQQAAANAFNPPEDVDVRVLAEAAEAARPSADADVTDLLNARADLGTAFLQNRGRATASEEELRQRALTSAKDEKDVELVYEQTKTDADRMLAENEEARKLLNQRKEQVDLGQTSTSAQIKELEKAGQPETLLKRTAEELMPPKATPEEQKAAYMQTEEGRKTAQERINTAREELRGPKNGAGRKIPPEFFDGLDAAISNVDRTFDSPQFKAAAKAVRDELSGNATLDALTEIPSMLADRLKSATEGRASKQQLTTLKQAVQKYTDDFFASGLGKQQRDAARAELKETLPILRKKVQTHPVSELRDRLIQQEREYVSLANKKNKTQEDFDKLNELQTARLENSEDVKLLQRVYGKDFLEGVKLPVENVVENIRALRKLPPEEKKKFLDIFTRGETQASALVKKEQEFEEFLTSADKLTQAEKLQTRLNNAVRRIDAPETQRKVRKAQADFKEANLLYGKVSLKERGKETFGSEDYSKPLEVLAPNKKDTPAQLEDKGKKLADIVNAASRLEKPVDKVERYVHNELQRMFLENAVANGVPGAEEAFKAFVAAAGKAGAEIPDLPKILQDKYAEALKNNSSELTMQWMLGNDLTNERKMIEATLNALAAKDKKIKEAIAGKEKTKKDFSQALKDKYNEAKKIHDETVKRAKEQEKEILDLGKKLDDIIERKRKEANTANVNFDRTPLGHLAVDPVNGIAKILKGDFGVPADVAQNLLKSLPEPAKRQVQLATQKYLKGLLETTDDSSQIADFKNLRDFLSSGLLQEPRRNGLRVLLGDDQFKKLDAAWRLMAQETKHIEASKTIEGRLQVKKAQRSLIVTGARSAAYGLGAFTGGAGYGYALATALITGSALYLRQVQREKLAHKIMVNFATNPEYAVDFFKSKKEPFDFAKALRYTAIASAD